MNKKEQRKYNRQWTKLNNEWMSVSLKINKVKKKLLTIDQRYLDVYLKQALQKVEKRTLDQLEVWRSNINKRITSLEMNRKKESFSEESSPPTG